MCKKLIYLISFALVLDLTMNAAEAADPGLVGWWRFEEGSGTTAYDSSGNGLDGTLVGGATWTDGRIGGGIELDGTSGYVSVPDFELTTDSITFVSWVNGWKGADWAPLISSREVGQCEMIFSDDDTLRYVWNDDSAATWGWTGGPVIPQDTWAMLAVTIDPDKAVAYVYTDNGGLTQSTNAIAHIEETVGALQIGYSYDPRYVRGIIDEAAVFDRALTEQEIMGLVLGIGEGYPYASISSPKDGSLIMDTWVNLGWRAGDFAVSHNVYIGDNFDAVDSGAEDTFIGNQADT
ncbi:MAG: LamG domain-containing protein, partial [Sedimentisphaerales bacterium]|nr:LamG domain-containing protein [Sedimentisphaerales bacterium]